MSAENFGDLLIQHKWIPALAVVVWMIVRLLKSDTKIPIDIPPRARALAAIGLGAVAGVLEKWTADSGEPWQNAVWNGLLVGGGAIIFHALAIDTLRGGKEMAIPWLTIPGTRPAPGKPVTDPPPPSNNGSGVVGVLLLVGTLALMSHLILACGYGKPACAVVDIAKENCDLWIKYLDERGEVKEIQIPREEANQFARATAKKKAQSADGGVQ